MNVLVLNCGSSTIKFQLVATDLDHIAQDADEHLAGGVVERIGGEAILDFRARGDEPRRSTAPVRDVRAAVETVIRWVTSADSGIEEVKSVADIHAVGHRVVHGGERFKQSALVTDEVVRGIEDCIDLAPLHNPGNIRGIQAAREVFGPGLPQVAVFDTAFHQTLPPHAYLYALPYQWYRRYRVRRLRGLERGQTNIITLHLGNGCSAAAIRGGDSLDTSMGMTPLEGLVMGTRSGDIDPAILDYVGAKEGLSMQEAESVLNKQSGLLGISGLTNDMRELLDESHESG